METVEQRHLTRSAGETPSAPRGELQLTTDELATLVTHAARLQGEERQKGREINSLEDAVSTAKDLGIDERYVLAAATEMQQHRTRIARLRTITRQRFSKLVGFLGLTVAVSAGVSLTAGTKTGLTVLFGMSIALFIMAGKWVQAWLQERYPDTFEFTREPRARRLRS
ncbi:MAG TPA: hypothetical protein VFL80_06195 [Thermoanaerobaculia bacterium]|nr:hypothetical protein [Thermoanaerobaculia bacterium]